MQASALNQMQPLPKQDGPPDFEMGRQGQFLALSQQ